MRSVSFGVLVVGLFVGLGLETIAQQRGQGGTPVPGLTPAHQLAFDEGSRVFAKNYRAEDGLGPIVKDGSCADCNRNGGGSNRTVRRFGRVDDRGDFDPLVELGGSLIQARGIRSITTADGTFDFVGERIPPEATVTARRRSHSILGMGFVDAVPNAAWLALAEEEANVAPETAGRVNIMLDLSTGQAAVGKFGWKAQVPSLAQFSADALLNEIGITNPLFREESCPQGDCLALGFNPTPALNDDGRDVEAIATFMTMLAAPPRGAIIDEANAGEQVFQEIGCASCHRPTLRTGPSSIRAFNRVDFHPYSDFLLHDMGSLGDGISQDRRAAARCGRSRCGAAQPHSPDARRPDDEHRRCDPPPRWPGRRCARSIHRPRRRPRHRASRVSTIALRSIDGQPPHRHSRRVFHQRPWLNRGAEDQEAFLSFSLKKEGKPLDLLASC